MVYTKKMASALLPALILILLLSHPHLSASGAQKGLLLWFNTVLPTLFPFMLFSRLLAERGGVRLLLAPFQPLLNRLGMSVYSGYALLTGLLCGYPMGMKTAADFNQKNFLSSNEKRLLTAVSGSPSPMFIAGYIVPRLHPSVPVSYLVAALYLPLLLMALLIGIYNKIRLFPPTVPAQTAEKLHPHTPFPPTPDPSSFSFTSFDDILMDCLELQVRIGGNIMLYSILASFEDAFFSGSLRLFLIGSAEMTTGIEQLSRSGFLGIPLQSASMAACAAFGGLSGIAQTRSVLKDREKNAGLFIRHYVLWKLVHASFSFILFIWLLRQMPPLGLQ